MSSEFDANETRWMKWATTRVVIGCLGFWLFWMAASPPYYVWQQSLVGEAELKRAQQNRKIIIEQAEAEKEASILRAQAEEDAAVFRANAIQVVGAAAKEFPEYRQQEFIGAFGRALENENIGTMIFVPTEANIPITEAGRTVKRFQPK